MKKLLVLAALLVAPFAVADDKKAADTAKADKTIAEIVSENKDFSTLLAAVKAADLAGALGEGEWTVFAPTNAAFEAVGKEKLDALLKDKEKLTAVLTSHAVKGTWLAADVVKLDGKEVETASGAKYKLSVKDKDVTIGNAKVVKTDIKAKNGVIHVIDAVLLPPAK